MVDAMIGFIAEVLVLHFHQAAGEQAGAGEQHDGQGRLDDDQDLLRERGAVAGAAVGAAQSFGWIGVRG